MFIDLLSYFENIIVGISFYFEGIFNYVISIYDFWFTKTYKFLETKMLYHFLLVGFNDYDSILHSYLTHNIDLISYPIMLELYGEQLDFGFHFMHVFERPLRYEVMDKTFENSTHFFLRNLFSETAYVNDWYLYNLYLRSYYSFIFDLPLNFNYFSFDGMNNFGLDFDLQIFFFNYNTLYYQPYDDYLKLFQDIEESSVNNFPENIEPLIDLYEATSFDAYVNAKVGVKKNLQDITLIRDNRLNYFGRPYKTGEAFGMQSDYVRAVWDYINESSEDSYDFGLYRWDVIKEPWWARSWWLYGPYEYWPEVFTLKFLFEYYIYDHFIQDILDEPYGSIPFDFGETHQIHERVWEYRPEFRGAMLWGQPTRDFWVYYLFHVYKSYAYTSILVSDMNTLDTEPHLEYDLLHSFLISNIDQTQINIYSEYYKDYMVDRPQARYDFFGMLSDMREQRLLQKLPLKTDHLVFFIDMYKKSDDFTKLYLDFNIYIYRICNWQDTLNFYFYSYCSWFNPQPYSRLKKIFDKICYLIWLYTTHPLDYLYWKYSGDVFFIFFCGLIISIGYLFQSLVKSLLPHNFLYALKGQRVQVKKRAVEKKVFSNLNKKIKLDYNFNDIKNYNYFLAEFFSKINNLESWIFNIEITDMKSSKKRKIFNFLKLDKKSKKSYFKILDTNMNIMLKNLKLNEHIKFFYDSNKILYNINYFFLVGIRYNWKTIRLFLKWALNTVTEIYYNRVRKVDDERYRSDKLKGRWLWTKNYTKFVFIWWGKPVTFKAPVYSVFTLIIALLKLLLYWIVFFIYAWFIWRKTNVSINDFYFKRQSFTENVLFKGNAQIKKWIENIELNIEEINNKLYRFSFKQFDKPEAQWLHSKHKDESEFSLYQVKATPGNRLYYFWVLFSRLFLLLFNNEKKLNVEIIGFKKYTWKYNFLRFKNYIAFLYWEYLIYRGNLKALNNFGYNFRLILEFFFGFICLLSLFIPFFIFVWICLIIFNFILYKVNQILFSINKFILRKELKLFINLFINVWTYFIKFWYFIFKDPKNNEGLILRFYIKIVYPFILRLYRFFFFTKESFYIGYKNKNFWDGIYNMLKYWGLLFLVFFSDLYILIYNFFVDFVRWFIIEFKVAKCILFIKYLIKNINNNYYYWRNMNFKKFIILFKTFIITFFDYEFEVNFVYILRKIFKIIILSIKYFFILIYYTINYILISFDRDLSIKLLNYYKSFYYLYLYNWHERFFIKIFYFKYKFYRNRHQYWLALKIFWKKDWKKTLYFIYLHLLKKSGYSYYIYKKTENFFIFDPQLKYDGMGYIQKINKIFWMPNFYKNFLKKIHVFFYWGGLNELFKIPVLEYVLDDLEKKRRNIVWHDRETWLSRLEILALLTLRIYVKIINNLYIILYPYINYIEKIYRFLDMEPLTRNWSLIQRFIFIFYMFIAWADALWNSKFFDVKSEKFVKKELYYRKKALRKFHFRAFCNFIGFFFFLGKIFYKKPGYIKINSKKINLEKYLDYNIKNIVPSLWFLAIFYHFFYTRIFKFYYSGENMRTVREDPQKSLQRIAGPRRINDAFIAQVTLAWVYNSGRFVLKILYSPVINWPFRFVVSLLGFLAQRGRFSNNKKYWYQQKFEDLFTDVKLINKQSLWDRLWRGRKKGYEDLDWALWMKETNRRVSIKQLDVNFKALNLKTFQTLGIYFKHWKELNYDKWFINLDEITIQNYEKIKKTFEFYLKANIDDNIFIPFFYLVSKDESTKNLIKEYKISLSDIFDFRFADFLKHNCDLKDNDRLFTNALQLKKRLEKVKYDEYVLINKRLKKAEEVSKNIQSISDYEFVASTKKSNFKGIVDYKMEKEEQRWWKRKRYVQRNKQVPWLSDTYFKINGNLPYIIKRAFKLSNFFYHWGDFVVTMRLYMQWFSMLEEESKVNNVLDEGTLLRKVWANMIEQGAESIYTDGGSVVNAYYINSWVYLYNYHEWAKDEDFDFPLQMFEQVQSVFLKNYYVNWISDIYFTRSNKRSTGDLITHSPLHYQRYFRRYKKRGWIYRWLRRISFITFFYVLFYLPGEYVLNYHLLWIPFSIWVISTIMYNHYKNYYKIMESKGAFFYKLDWREYNPYWDDPEQSDKFYKKFRGTYTRNPYYLWEDGFLGNILWVFTFSWYILDWYETEAWRHRWFPWDYNFAGAGLQDIIHDDGFNRICGGKNYFSVPYANTYRARARWDLLPVDGYYNVETKQWDYAFGIDKFAQLNYFIEKCSFYVKFFICSDRMRYLYPRSDITQNHLTEAEFIDFINTKINNLVNSTDNNNINKSVNHVSGYNRDVLLSEDENWLFIYINLKEFNLWYKNFIINCYTTFENFIIWLDKSILFLEDEKIDFFSLGDMRDRMDFFDYHYFHISCYIYEHFIFIYNYFFFYLEFFFNYINQIF